MGINIQKLYKFFLADLLLFLLSSASIPLVLFSESGSESLNAAGYAAGILFWAGLFGGILLYIVLIIKEGKRVKVYLKEEGRLSKIPGLIRFFGTPEAVVSDVLMIAGIIASVYTGRYAPEKRILSMVSLWAALFGLYAHGLFNGNMYRVLSLARKKEKGNKNREKA